MLQAKTGNVAIHFKGRYKKKIKIDALKSKLDAYYLDGGLLMKGFAGVNGPYQGWFAADRQRPPLKANLEVWIGSVTVELEKWKGWDPD